MKQIWKRIVAIICALALVCSGVVTQGNSQTVHANSEEQSATVEGAEFGKTDSYLQLTGPLGATPSAVEATVKMDKCDEWTIVSADEEAQSIKYPSQTTINAEWQTNITTCPDDSLTYSGFYGAADYNYGFRKTFDIDVPDIYTTGDIAIEFWIYSPDDINTKNGELEITSSGKSDYNEISWIIGTDIVLTEGWNYIKLPLNTATTVNTGGTFELCNVNFLRWYSKNSASSNVTFAISDVKLVVLDDDSEDMILASAKNLSSLVSSDIKRTTWQDTIPGTDMEYVQLKSGTVRCHYKAINVNASAYQNDELAVSFWIYSSATLSSIIFELGSGDSAGSNELKWDFGADVSQGWNYIELPLSEGKETASFDKSSIKRLRIHTATVNGDESNEPTICVSEIKLINRGIQYSFANAKSSFNVTDTYTTVASDMPGGGLVCHEYTATNNVAVLAKWEITDSAQAINLNAYTTDEIGLAFWIYSDIANPKGSLELSSVISGHDSAEYQLELNNCGIQEGWNYIEVPLRNIPLIGTVDLSSIVWMRLHTLTIEDDNVIRMSEPVIRIHKVTESSDTVSAHMIFSNVNAEGETVPYALAVTKNGYPTFIYGSTQYTLDYDIRTNEKVDLKVVQNSESKIAFYVDGLLKGTSENAVTSLEAPITPYCIGADSLGNQFMQGYIYNVCMSDGEGVLGSWTITSDVSKDIPDANGSSIYAEYKGTAVENCKYVTRYYSEIEDYREDLTDEKYTNVPVKSGYVFAGWYTDDTCVTSLTSDTTSGDACAKFVDAKILTVKAQAKYTENSDEQKLDIRYVTTVDTLNYKEIGFVVTNRAGTEYVYEEEYVYPDLTAAGVTYKPADQFSQHSKKFATIQMTGVTIADENSGILASRSIPVKAYWVTKDGSVVYGASRDVLVSDAVTSAENASATVISVE